MEITEITEVEIMIDPIDDEKDHMRGIEIMIDPMEEKGHMTGIEITIDPIDDKGHMTEVNNIFKCFDQIVKQVTLIQQVRWYGEGSKWRNHVMYSVFYSLPSFAEFNIHSSVNFLLIYNINT